MRCAICDEIKPDRKNGDHLLQKALGKFTPDLTSKRICEQCDNEIGGRVEKYTGRRSINGWMRTKFGLANPNTKGKRRRIYNPLLDCENTSESPFFRFKYLDQALPARLDENGNVRYHDKIEFKYRGATETVYFENPNAMYMADKLWDRIYMRRGYELRIFCSKELLRDISNITCDRMKRSVMGDPLGESELKSKENNEIVRCALDMVIDENFYRGVAYSTIKLMICRGISIRSFDNILRFVKGESAFNCGITIKPTTHFRKILTDHIPKSEYWHLLFSCVQSENIEFGAIYFGHNDCFFKHVLHSGIIRTPNLIIPGLTTAFYSFDGMTCSIMHEGKDIASLIA
jgi:hypothetical protein